MGLCVRANRQGKNDRHPSASFSHDFTCLIALILLQAPEMETLLVALVTSLGALVLKACIVASVMSLLQEMVRLVQQSMLRRSSRLQKLSPFGCAFVPWASVGNARARGTAQPCLISCLIPFSLPPCRCALDPSAHPSMAMSHALRPFSLPSANLLHLSSRLLWRTAIFLFPPHHKHQLAAVPACPATTRWTLPWPPPVLPPLTNAMRQVDSPLFPPPGPCSCPCPQISPSNSVSSSSARLTRQVPSRQFA